MTQCQYSLATCLAEGSGDRRGGALVVGGAVAAGVVRPPASVIPGVAVRRESDTMSQVADFVEGRSENEDEIVLFIGRLRLSKFLASCCNSHLV